MTPGHKEPGQEIAESRSKTYWLLSRFFLERPEPPFLEEMLSLTAPDPQREAEDEDGLLELRRVMSTALSREDAAMELHKEYTRLLRGIEEGYGPPPPYESLYRENRLMGETTAGAIRHYREAGFGDIVPEAGPQDHIGVELRYLSLLCYRLSETLTAGDRERASAILSQQRRFLDGHLLRWAGTCLERIEGESRSPFYRIAARMTRDFLDLDRALLDTLHDESRVA